MSECEIKDIVVKTNPRKDFGNIDELTASIREKGVLEPLLVTKDFELIAGERRLKAAKAAGLKTVPVVLVDMSKEDTDEIRIIENIQRKDLTAVEEGDAYASYIKRTKHDYEYLAKKLGKSSEYVRKRVLISGLPDVIKKGLQEGKINIGHALLLAKMEASVAEKYYKEILQQDHSVKGAIEHLQYSHLSSRLADASFDKKECKGCTYNGSEQAELFETGKALTGRCTNPSCFTKKISEHVKAKKEEFKEVIFDAKSDYDTPKGFIRSDAYEWGEGKTAKKYQDKLKKEKNPENYTVHVHDDGRVVEYFKPPKKDKKNASDDEPKGNRRSLKDLVSEWKDRFVRDTGKTLILPGSNQLKALIVWHFANNSVFHEEKTEDRIKEVLGIKNQSSLENCREEIFKASSEALDKALAISAESVFDEVDFEEFFAKQFGFDIKKHFVMTEGYLKLHTKDQLTTLAKELKMDLGKAQKNGEIINIILKEWKAGQVPKILLEKNKEE